MPASIDSSICPLCQQQNHCGVNNAEPCWCTKSKMPAKLLAQVPKQLQKKSCICQACLKKFNLNNIKEVR
ncbi:cysteine-rich CWC family protein [Thalassotalea insulae]|uniref:cysteine-rich CWC family protein n=1 Tax=Thalassotalea insulae TaxID=2056778 RepID=UPI0024E09824|nr:cysteine-rich CWC family protein [Thalassotalea insulae]